jgi:hypothetical protein
MSLVESVERLGRLLVSLLLEQRFRSPVIVCQHFVELRDIIDQSAE